jgi:hypothetical protein
MSEVPDRLIEYDELEHLRMRKIWSQTNCLTPPCEQEACLAVLFPRAAVFTASLAIKPECHSTSRSMPCDQCPADKVLV